MKNTVSTRIRLGLRWFAIALLGLVFSIGIHSFNSVPVGAQDSALALMQTGKEYYEAGRFAEAANSLQTAARSLATKGDTQRQAQALSLSSLAYQKLGDWQAAKAAIATSLFLLDSSTSPSSSAQALNAQAHLQQATGDTEAALQTWQQAEALYAKADDQMGIIGSQINQAQALRSLGFFRRAEKMLAQLEQTILQLPNSALKTSGLHTLGSIRRQSGDLYQSQQLLTQGLNTAKSLSSPQEESKLWLSLGNTERTLATQMEQQGDNTEATRHLNLAIAAYKQGAAIATTPLTKVQAQLNYLSILVETNQPTAANSLTTQVISELAQLPPGRASIFAYINFAQTLMRLKYKADPIAQLLATAVQRSIALNDLRSRSYALGTLGALYEQTGQRLDAQRVTEQALQIAQTLNALELAYQWQWQLGRLLQTQSGQGSTAAIAYYRAAVQTINSLRSDLVTLNPDVQFSFRESVEPVYRQYVNLLLQAKQPGNDALIAARSTIEALQLAEIDNFFRDACARAATINIDDLDPTAAIVYPILLPDRLELIVKLPRSSTLQHYRTLITATQVDQTVGQLQNLLRRRSASPRQIKQTAQTLYSWLIQPWEIELHRASQPVKTLVFVLDGSLRNLPPSVLFDGSQYLVERYAIAVTPGLQLLDPKPIPRKQLQVLLAGATDAPSFSKNGFAPIENVETELKRIQSLVPGQTLKNQAFVRENLQQRIQTAPFNVVHVATHGQFSSNPEQTFILDWHDRIPVKELDALLRIGSQRDVTSIELLILSACETAAGDDRAALGLAGIAIRAGARSTLASLFQVNDSSTAELMIRFYQQLQDPQLTKAEALRRAQLSFLQPPSSSSEGALGMDERARPYFWAPFILVGNWL